MPRRHHYDLIDEILDEMMDTIMIQVEAVVAPYAKTMARDLAQQIGQIEGQAREQAREKQKRAVGGRRPHTPRPAPSPTPPQGHRPTLYDVLGVSPTAPPEVIQGAYRALARIYHPDVPKTGNKVKMQALTEAYGVLSDKAKRKEYDTTYIFPILSRRY